MSKRLTETEKWSDRWFRRLSSTQKLGWLYLLDVCDCAGVAQIDDDLSEFQIGCRVDWPSLVAASEGRIEELPNGKLHVLRFIDFQYGNLDYTKGSGIAKGVQKRLEHHGLWKGFPKGSGTVPSTVRGTVKDKDKDKDQVKDQGGCGGEFARWWAVFPRKVGKRAAQRAYEKAVSEIRSRGEPGSDSPHEFLLGRLSQFAESDKAKGDFCPYPATWLNEGRYDDDPAAWGNSSAEPEVKPLSREEFLSSGGPQ